MKFIFIPLIGIYLLITNADGFTQEEQLHMAAHGGATYAITHITEVVCDKLIDKKLVCTMAGIALSNGINIGRKAQQDFPNDSKQAITSGAIGSILAAGMITIDF